MSDEKTGIEGAAKSALESMPDSRPDADGLSLLGIPQLIGKVWHLSGKPLRDKRGDLFSDDRHKSNANGMPIVSKLGHAIGKPGRPKKPTAAPPVNPASSGSIPPGGLDGQGTGPAPPDLSAVAEAHEKEYRTLAALTVVNIESLMRATAGEKWRMQKGGGFDERATLTDAWTEYYKARGIRHVPPELMILAAMSGYFAPRINWVEVKKLGRAGLERAGMLKPPSTSEEKRTD